MKWGILHLLCLSAFFHIIVYTECLKIKNVGVDTKIYAGKHESFLGEKLLQEEIIVSFSVNS